MRSRVSIGEFMNWGAVANLPVSATAIVAGLASLGYVTLRMRIGSRPFAVFDAITVVLLMAIVTVGAVPLLAAVSRGAKQTVLEHNLSAIRSQIALYKLDHRGEPPLAYHSTMPQMIQATDSNGIPGPPDRRRPFGPYLLGEVPPNPITGRNCVTITATFPPTAASGNGGWLYHQESGQIAADLPDMLDR